MDDLLSSLSGPLLAHWPFVSVMAILTVVGQVSSKSFFTRDRAYLKQKASAFYKFWEAQWFWWWGRETLALHPIVSGALIGLIWQNPEGADPAWKLIASVVYFAAAGFASLFAWSILRSYLKKKGVELELPGGVSSITPPPLEDDK